MHVDDDTGQIVGQNVQTNNLRTQRNIPHNWSGSKDAKVNKGARCANKNHAKLNTSVKQH